MNSGSPLWVESGPTPSPPGSFALSEPANRIARRYSAAAASQRMPPARGRPSVRAHVVFLADVDAVVAQQRVGGRDVEEELRQAVIQQVGLAANAALLRRARSQEDRPVFTAVEAGRIDAVDEGERPRDAGLQFGERLLAVVVRRHVHPGQT